MCADIKRGLSGRTEINVFHDIVLIFMKVHKMKKLIFFFCQPILVKLPPIVRTFGKKILYLQMEELFDSIATQNAEIRTVAKSSPLFFK